MAHRKSEQKSLSLHEKSCNKCPALTWTPPSRQDLAGYGIPQGRAGEAEGDHDLGTDEPGNALRSGSDGGADERNANRRDHDELAVLEDIRNRRQQRRQHRLRQRERIQHPGLRARGVQTRSDIRDLAEPISMCVWTIETWVPKRTLVSLRSTYHGRRGQQREDDGVIVQPHGHQRDPRPEVQLGLVLGVVVHHVLLGHVDLLEILLRR